MTLDRAPLRTPLTLTSADTEPETRRRLAAMGLRPGARVELLHKTPGGGRVVSVAGSRIALGRVLLSAMVASRIG